MASPSTERAGGASDWGSDFFGTLNEMPPEPVHGIGHILEAMSTLPAFRDARQWVLRNLSISQGSSVIEAGCGNAAALAVYCQRWGRRGGWSVSIQPTPSSKRRVHGLNDSVRPKHGSKWVTFARSVGRRRVRRHILRQGAHPCRAAKKGAGRNGTRHSQRRTGRRDRMVAVLRHELEPA